MISPSAAKTSSPAGSTVVRVAEIPNISHREATQMARAEYERVMEVLEQLSGDDWQQPTFCTDWSVLDMVAHMTGAAAGHASWNEFVRQYVMNPYMRDAKVKVDAINRVQVEQRRGTPPAEIVQEFRSSGPKAIRTRDRLPWLLRVLPIPFGPPLGTAPVAYLTDVIYTHDWWMHRYDLCHATGKPMRLTAGHDGRVIALVLRDMALRIGKRLDGHLVELRLAGPAGATYWLGSGATLDAAIGLDTPEFALLASERIAPSVAEDRASISGDAELASWVLQNSAIPF